MNYLIKGGLISSFKLQKLLTDNHPVAAAQGFMLPRPAGGCGWTGLMVTEEKMRIISDWPGTLLANVMRDDKEKDKSTRLVWKQVIFLTSLCVEGVGAQLGFAVGSAF